MSAKQIAIIGGGAAGFFTAIQIKLHQPSAQVTIYEKSQDFLQKVRVSGGGRCNVTHACFDPKELAAHYPRGQKELLGPFHHFQPGDTIAFFEERGIALKAEEDGRMFPTTDSSETIIRCFMDETKRLGVRLETGRGMKSLEKKGEGWRITFLDFSTADANAVVVATGSQRSTWDILATLGHSIVEPVPSLFTFRAQCPLVPELAGISSPVSVSIPTLDLEAEGPILITHRGFSGPAILRLSAWGARKLAQVEYRFELRINWAKMEAEELREAFDDLRQRTGAALVKNARVVDMPRRLWEMLCERMGDKRWAELTRQELDKLIENFCNYPVQVNGKDTFKEEFVTAGGVALEEMNFKTMESRIHKGLHLAGEVLNIDAITGGFNFQACWTESYLIGKGMTEKT